MTQPHDDRIDSWKEISKALGRGERTIRRWEKERGLHVHRVPGGGHPGVYAFRSEIDAWLRGTEAAGRGISSAEPPDPATAVPSAPQTTSGTVFRQRLDPNFTQEASAVTIDRPQAQLVAFQHVASHRWPMLAGIALGFIILVAGPVLWFRRGGQLIPTTSAADEPTITSVVPSALLPRPLQTIVIKGSHFGELDPFENAVTPFLAIRDQTVDWAAGRVIPQNTDEVTLNVESWKDSQIVVTRFAGAYGTGHWKLNPGDEIEIAVWNPQTGAGPALYHLRVTTSPTKE